MTLKLVPRFTANILKGRILLILAAFGCFFLGFLALQAATFFKHSTGTRFYQNIALWSSPENESDESFGDVKMFVMFTGHARSGHSIVGAMMDAHPQMVVAHEYDIPEHWEEINKLAQLKRLPMRNVIMQLLVEHSRRDSQAGTRRKKGPNSKSYEYYIPGQWQGKVDGQMKANIVAYYYTVKQFIYC